MVERVFKCESHVRGHRSEEAATACGLRRERRLARLEKREQDSERRVVNQRRESETEFIRRRYCRDGELPERVAASLNRDYPRRDDRPWSWADVIAVHAEHLNWPTKEQLMDWLEKHPNVMLPSVVRKYAGVSAESHVER